MVEPMASRAALELLREKTAENARLRAEVARLNAELHCYKNSISSTELDARCRLASLCTIIDNAIEYACSALTPTETVVLELMKARKYYPDSEEE